MSWIKKVPPPKRRWTRKPQPVDYAPPPPLVNPERARQIIEQLSRLDESIQTVRQSLKSDEFPEAWVHQMLCTFEFRLSDAIKDLDSQLKTP